MMAVIEPKSYYRADSAEEAHNEMIKNVAEDIDMATLAKISQVNEIIGNLERQKTMEEHFEELEKLVNAPATLEEGIQKMYEADKYLVENISLFEKSKERPSNMFFTLIDIWFMRRQYEIKVKEMISDALVRGEEVYVPVFRFDGQISNLGNVRKMSDNSPVEKYLIDGVEAVAFDLVYGKDEGDVEAFEVNGLFDSILNSIAKGWYVEGEEDYKATMSNHINE
jgi:hypothetical protein